VGFLSDKVEKVRRELERHPLDESTLMARVLAMPPTRDFIGALRAGSPSVIAEVKRASPSAGAIADPDPTAQARAYAGAGAAAISVLTDAEHFDGSLADLAAVRTATELPLLRKDFIVHPAQLIEARASGADAALLIVGALAESELAALLGACGDLGLAAFVEVHSDHDVEVALQTPAQVIGVNARDLESLEVDTDLALARLARIPADRVAVMESGISSHQQVRAAVGAGASAVLVGEALMRAADPGAKLRELVGDRAGETSR
jgi:indole-3-glycerol phosphate synthase